MCGCGGSKAVAPVSGGGATSPAGGGGIRLVQTTVAAPEPERDELLTEIVAWLNERTHSELIVLGVLAAVLFGLRRRQ